MRYLSEKQAKQFFEDIVKNEFGSFDLELSDGEAVMINGKVVKDWRNHSAHAVIWYDEATDTWSVTNLSPQTYWAIMEDGFVTKFVNSLDFAMHRCGFNV